MSEVNGILECDVCGKCVEFRDYHHARFIGAVHASCQAPAGHLRLRERRTVKGRVVRWAQFRYLRDGRAQVDVWRRRAKRQPKRIELMYCPGTSAREVEIYALSLYSRRSP